MGVSKGGVSRRGGVSELARFYNEAANSDFWYKPRFGNPALTMQDILAQFILPLIAGGIAGTAVDIVLFPLDTVKTRLQSKIGFWAAGGFRNIYAGIGPAAIGSAPSAATFFCTYELAKSSLSDYLPETYTPFIHMLAASLGEITSSLVRVPFEVTKQRAQATTSRSPLHIARHTWRTEGLRGMYRGYFSVVFREVPFAFIQYPTWEYCKSVWSAAQGREVEPWQGAVCGAIAGGFAAALTTPLDVLKTRIMLAQKGESEVTSSMLRLLLTIAQKEGMKGLFAGFVPRVSWISIGGFVFLGAYDKSRHHLHSIFHLTS